MHYGNDARKWVIVTYKLSVLWILFHCFYFHKYVIQVISSCCLSLFSYGNCESWSSMMPPASQQLRISLLVSPIFSLMLLKDSLYLMS